MRTDEFLSVGRCEIDPTAQICRGAIVGKPFRPLIGGSPLSVCSNVTTIGANAYIGYYAVVGSGSVLSEGVILDDYCIVESNVTIGSNTLITYRAQICNDARIGKGCVIGGFVAERVVVGDHVRIFGKIVHTHHDPSRDWDADESMEPSATIERGAFVGFDALVIGDVTIGERAFVCAGAIVTKSVPSRHIAYGVNQIVPFCEWKGSLSKSPFFTR